MCSMATQTISGRVLRTNTRTFTFGARVSRSNIPEVRQFVKTEPLTLKTSSQPVTVVGANYKNGGRQHHAPALGGRAGDIQR